MAQSAKGPQPATDLTKTLNAAVVVPPQDKDAEFALAQKGLITPMPPDYTVDGTHAKVPAWSLAPYSDFLSGSAPDTVNPSLWRNALLNMNCGLYEVVENSVYQVRGGDMANVSFLEDPTQNSRDIVVVDPLQCIETAASALEMYLNERGPRTIVAIIYTHCHADHYGGARGLFTATDGVPEESVKIYAPDGFLEHAVSENVYAGNAMTRRALFMYGGLLPRGARGQVDAGLGKAMATGTVGLLAPTDVITVDQRIKVGPIQIEFQLTPDTEAPAEMNFYLPASNALCMAENATPTLHNLYSLRGAQVRDAKNWSQYLNTAADRFGKRSDVLFASHFWPRWREDGGNQIVDFLTSQADMYRFLHDQTLRLANHGRTMHEIAEDLDQSLPDSLADRWFNHGYYGTTNHNIKAVYQRYLGWFDGNVAHLHGLPPDKVGARYVAAIGGAEQVVAQARQAFDDATGVEDYRWAAELLSHVVFAGFDQDDEQYRAARHLEAQVLEQLGYQAESGPWRNFYLAGAHELRRMVPLPDGSNATIITDDVISAMPLDMVCDYLGIRLNGIEAAQQSLTIGLTITGGLPTDPDHCVLRVRNGVLVYEPLRRAPSEETVYRLTRDGLNDFALGKVTPDELLADGALTIVSGAIDPFDTLNSCLEDFALMFPVTLS